MKAKNGKTKTVGKLPFVLLNVAMTADGKIATANRAVSSFGSLYDKDHLMELRATTDAVMSGARTADLNDITLGPGSAKYRRARLRHGLAEYNLRIIVSGLGTINPRAEIFKHRFSPLIVLVTERAGERRIKMLRKVADEVRVCGKNEIDFRGTLHWLREKWKVKRLVCEGGGAINDALFRANVVNEIHVTVTPHIFGGRLAPTLADGAGAGSLSLATNLKLKSARWRGQEMFLVYRVSK
ncbi:MAG TPA: dihydrofolate reductase family protein [Candidatus Limnocylindrales bacterium]|nr:dihydrofolate reductase family protein [Candidatus Limnocylindrales bacterium]